MPKFAVVFFDLGETLATQDRKWLPGAQALLASLRQAGYALGILSNTGDLKRTDILRLLPADFDLGAFDEKLVVFSSEVGHEKPDPAIFKLAVARAKHPAGACLYCSESIVETLGAQAAGMRAVRVQVAPHSDLGDLGQAIGKYQGLKGVE
jgi:putative hydrolase of the HAD superfamily